jgi:hypothetical protein
MRLILALLLIGITANSCIATEGPSLDYLKGALNKATYSEVVLESEPATSREVLADGTSVAIWNSDLLYINDGVGGKVPKFKMCIFNPQGILVRYKWKRGLLGGDSKEDNDESSSKAKVKPKGSSSR